MIESIHMRSQSLVARDVASHLHPFTDLSALKANGGQIIERGEGVYVFDSDGRRYLEGMSGLWCASLGYSEQRLVEAATRQFRRLPFDHAFRGRTHDVTVELAERLLTLAPVPMSKVFFANSGSEANDSAMKLVWYYHNAIGRPARRKIISRHKGYHGTTVGAASLSGLPDLHRDFNLPIPGIIYADCPHFWRRANPSETEEQFVARLVANLEHLIVSEGPETIGAFIAEPIMGVGAVIVPPPSYFAQVQAVLRKYEILFIADEVICGFGRTGNMFGSQTFDLQPDIITVAKGLSSGYLPMSAMMISENIATATVRESEKLGIFGHGFTYSGHPVCSAVALETLKIYEERDIVGRVRRLAPRLQQGLRALSNRALVGEVRGIGLIAAVELVEDKESRTPFSPKRKVGSYLALRAEAHGLFVRAIGDSITFSPPLIIVESEIDELLDSFECALNETEAAVTEGRI
jgi:4-aminobutyrate--pyruvate transaminase